MTDHDHDEPKPGRLETAEDVREFALAGNATLTLVSQATKARFTYRIRSVPKDDDRPAGPVSHFVHVLTDPDNERGFTYLGNVYTRGAEVSYGHGRKARIHEGAPSASAIKWFFEKIIRDRKSPDELKVEVWHEGRCGACGRKLTVPESIARGIGPECAAKQGRLA